jgi:hypothetical protein
MILSERERYIVLGTVLAVVALALDHFALTPLLAGRSEADNRKKALVAEMSRARSTLKLSQGLKPRWREMVQAGIKSEPAEAESQVLHAIRDWAEESGAALSLLKPDRQTDKTRLPEISFQASGAGNMKALARLLWRIQSAAIPIKVTKVQVSARKEGSDDLSFQLNLSTVYSPSRPAPATAASGPSATPGGR